MFILGSRRVYIFSQLVYSVGALCLAYWPYEWAVFVLSPAAGIMYATLFTMPYMLVASYHSEQTVSCLANTVIIRKLDSLDITQVRINAGGDP